MLARNKNTLKWNSSLQTTCKKAHHHHKSNILQSHGCCRGKSKAYFSDKKLKHAAICPRKRMGGDAALNIPYYNVSQKFKLETKRSGFVSSCEAECCLIFIGSLHDSATKRVDLNRKTKRKLRRQMSVRDQYLCAVL